MQKQDWLRISLFIGSTLGAIGWLWLCGWGSFENNQIGFLAGILFLVNIVVNLYSLITIIIGIFKRND